MVSERVFQYIPTSDITFLERADMNLKGFAVI